jgi:hypothetical protein
MLKYDNREVLYSIHLFKTAGNSLHSILKKWFGRGFIHHKYDPKSQSVVKKKTNRRSLLGRQIPVCIHGHFPMHADKGIQDIYPDFKQCITFLREPVELQISAYFFNKKLFDSGQLYYHGEIMKEFPYGELDSFIENTPSYLLADIPWKLDHSNFVDIINENFVHIGLADYFDQSISVLSKKLSKRFPSKIPIKNRTDREYSASQRSKNIFREKNKLEYEIYEYVKSINNLQP